MHLCFDLFAFLAAGFNQSHSLLTQPLSTLRRLYKFASIANESLTIAQNQLCFPVLTPSRLIITSKFHDLVCVAIIYLISRELAEKLKNFFLSKGFKIEALPFKPCISHFLVSYTLTMQASSYSFVKGNKIIFNSLDCYHTYIRSEILTTNIISKFQCLV